MAIYVPTPGFKKITAKHCVLNRCDFNFCARSSTAEQEEEGDRETSIVLQDMSENGKLNNYSGNQLINHFKSVNQ